MGLISSFSITTSTSTPVLSTKKNKDHNNNNNNNNDYTTTNFQPSGSLLHNGSLPDNANNTRRKPSELKFKIESIGIQPEEDDDLDTCPARTRAVWPSHLTPWWQPSHPKDRPPYPYSTLIAYAILVSQDGRLLLSDIYKWISETYPYYSLNNKGWQNSIRHNLSLYKRWFLKVDRRPTQANPGKGCYWTLVPGTEQMFIDNIAEAGGHSRKHHDIGLTKELSMGHHNHLLSNHPILSTNSNNSNNNSNNKNSNNNSIVTNISSSLLSSINKPNNNTSNTGGINPTFSHTNMKIILPEDYQQQENAKKNSSSSSSNSINHPNNNENNDNHSNENKNNPILSKTCKKKPSLNPTFGSFRISSSNNNEETAKRSIDKVLTDQDPNSQVMKRIKLDMDVDIEYMDPMNNDNQSDCDSGIDVDNVHLQHKGASNNKLITSDGLVLDKDEIELYSVLDTFLDQLPIPPTTNTVTMFDQQDDNMDPSSTSMLPLNIIENINQTNCNSLPVHPLDSDPILGFPTTPYYSTDGFFFDSMETEGMTQNTLPNVPSTDDPHHQSSTTTYPNVLTSSFEPNLSNMMLDMNDTIVPFEKLNGPIVINLNGQQHHHLAISTGMSNGEMTDEFLKFDDDFITPRREMENDTLDPSLLLSGINTEMPSDTFDFNIPSMCDLMGA
ncbi:unnamed protein product [Cunninghamella blakesleeana]